MHSKNTVTSFLTVEWSETGKPDGFETCEFRISKNTVISHHINIVVTFDYIFLAFPPFQYRCTFSVTFRSLHRVSEIVQKNKVWHFAKLQFFLFLAVCCVRLQLLKLKILWFCNLTTNTKFRKTITCLTSYWIFIKSSEDSFAAVGTARQPLRSRRDFSKVHCAVPWTSHWLQAYHLTMGGIKNFRTLQK